MIQVKNLKYQYPNAESDTLTGINFQIDKGEIFGFLGPSGAGKTTTQKILIGILKNYGGSVSVMDQEISQVHADYYETIGVSFEFPNLYTKFTALENLNFFSKLYKGSTEPPMTLLEMVGLKEDANIRVSDYSKGMKMRLNFIRALLNKPELIFLDEPTSGLDPVNLKKVKDIILEQKAKGKTVIVTTHDMHVADSICDRVAFIVAGDIALIDSPRNLKLQHGQKKVAVEYHDNGVLQKSVFDLNSLNKNKDFMALLNNGIIETMHTQEASLDDIFIKTTGRSLL